MPDRMIVDGYNVMYASKELEALIREDIDAARDRFLSELEEYCAREERIAEVVFDAAGRPGPAVSKERSAFLVVTFTAEGQSADGYIERFAYRNANEQVGSVLLVTGDYDQQKVASGAGLLRMSSREFLIEMRESEARASEGAPPSGERGKRVTVAERLPEDVRAALERFRESH